MRDTAIPPQPPGGPGRPMGQPGAVGPGGPGGPGGPTYPGMMGQPPMGGDPMGGGVADPASQMQSMTIRMGMEIDMKIKQLAQIVPLMQPWAQRVSEELKAQLAQSLQGGAAPTTPATGMTQFPDGTGRL